MPLGPGARLGPYEVVSAIGAGGMGEVYRARDTRLDRTVAIKILPAAVAGDPTFRERFDREARAVAALNHPHICTLYDIGEDAGTAFLVMEHLEGETLADRLAKGALQLDQALRYSIQIAEALDKAHRAGIVHRDLKPGNIMLTKSGAKLLDFGLAKTSAPTGLSSLSILPTAHTPVTAQGTILGTLQYMAPEQVEGREADARSDIFAFGAIVYEMVTGKRAFEGKSQASVIVGILERPSQPMQSVQPTTPRMLDRIVLKCLEKDPERRWQSSGDIIDQLAWVVDAGAQVTTKSPTINHARRLVFALTIVTLLLVAIAVGYEVWTARDPSPQPPAVRFEIATPPTDDPASFALSPNGRAVIFAATDAEGTSRLWLRPIDDTDPRPLAGTENATYPFWSADSKSIAFFSDLKLKRIDLDGGTPRDLADAPAGRGGTWNRDDVILFAPTTQSGLMRVSASGGPVTSVLRGVAGQPGLQLRWPQFLPDQNHFLFFGFLTGPGAQGTYVSSLDGMASVRIVDGDAPARFVAPDYLLTVRQNELVAWHFDPTRTTIAGEASRLAESAGRNSAVGLGMFSASSNDLLIYRRGDGAQRRQLIWVDRGGRTLDTVGPIDVTSRANPELSPDGRRIAVSRTVDGNVDVWIIDVARFVQSRFTFDATADANPVWSPDGSQLVFGSARNGAYDLFSKLFGAGVGAEHPLLTSNIEKRPHSWSPDGRHLLYLTYDVKTGSDLWTLPMTGKGEAFPVVRTNFSETEGQISPDGQWLAYGSNQSGRFEVYVQAFPGPGQSVQVSTNGGTQVRWRTDGRELYYVAPNGDLMAVSITAATDKLSIQSETPVRMFHTHLATGANVTGGKPQYAVAADGRFLINTKIDDPTPSPISVVLNWTASLTK